MSTSAASLGITGIGVVILWTGAAEDVAVRVITDSDGNWQLPTLTLANTPFSDASWARLQRADDPVGTIALEAVGLEIC